MIFTQMRVLLLTAILLITASESARILVVQPTPARGHSVVTEPLFEALAARGHQLTIITSYPHTPTVTNLQEIDVSGETKAKEWFGNVSVDFIKQYQPNQFQSLLFMVNADYSICEAVYSNNRVRELIKSNEKFDMVITEIFVNDCFVAFAAKFKAPLVSVVTSYALPWVADRVGLPDNPAYISNYFMDFGNRMNFFERVYNTLFLMYTKLLYCYVSVPQTQTLVNKYFGDSLPSVSDITKNTSLVLVNSYFPLAGSRPFTPNVVEIGGIHIRNTSSQVPKDLQEILDKSTQGVLVVSFGSLVRMASLDKQVIKIFLASFAKIQQTVFFKYEEELADVPKNVVVRKWLPQRDIVAHKNVKAVFIHGGLASTTEAVFFSKPLIGVPFFSDQFLNIKSIARQGAGLLLELDSISEHILDHALHEVLNNPQYSERASHLSALFRDRPQPPLQTAVYWLEYVLRHRGAPQLRPTSVDLHPGQYLLLDIAAVLLGGVYIAYWVLRRIFRVIKGSVRKYKKKID